MIKLISQVIADFANGEIAQATSLFDTELTLQQYRCALGATLRLRLRLAARESSDLARSCDPPCVAAHRAPCLSDKSFYKTASLIAASCRSAAVFSDSSEEVKAAMYTYGKHLGLAFQIVDDILDFTQTAEQLGKPRFQDIASGNLTAPTLFAMQKSPELRSLVETEFLEEGSLERAVALIESTGGYADAKALARSEANTALSALKARFFTSVFGKVSSGRVVTRRACRCCRCVMSGDRWSSWLTMSWSECTDAAASARVACSLEACLRRTGRISYCWRTRPGVDRRCTCSLYS